MAFNSRLHYICMLTILICHYVKGNYLPTGQVFLLAFPRTTMDTVQYHFFVYTMSKKQISVHLSTKNFDPNNELDYTMTVSRDNPGSYVADHRYRPQVQVGVTYVFQLTSTEDFSTTALVRASPSQMEALQAVPVEAWGKKYMAISFDYTPTLNIITQEGPNEITIEFKISLPRTFHFTADGHNYNANDNVFSFTLQALHSFVISYCETGAHVNAAGAITGSVITSQLDIGVISGSCLAWTPMRACEATQPSDRDITGVNNAIEMMPPTKNLGKEFMIFDILGRITQPVAFMVTMETDTVIAVSGNSGGVSHRNTEAVEIFTHSATFPYYVKSDKPIMVYVQQLSACKIEDMILNDGEPANPSLCVIVPMNLFYDVYQWSTPEGLAVANYAAINIRVQSVPHLRIDYLPMPVSIMWNPVVGIDDYRVGNHEVRPGYHQLYAVETAMFAVYIYGIGDDFSFMYPLPYLTTPVNTECERSIPTMSEGDTLDNDCDGRIEEEKRDDIDNDGDGIVDEDLIKPNRQNGAWTEWVYTDCTKNCSELKRYGTRTCTNPVPQNFGDDCEGVSAEVQTEGCHVKHRCPGVCPEGQWNVDCTSKCERCYPDCDKWDGTCMACDIGYVLRNGKCDQACGPLTYGFKCGGNCMEKCGTDCVDRVFGKCPPKQAISLLPYLALFLLTIPCIIMLIFFLRRREATLFPEGNYKSKSDKRESTATAKSSQP